MLRWKQPEASIPTSPSMPIEYLTEELPRVSGVPLRRGRVGCVVTGLDGQLISDTRLQLSANSTHALLGHGVVDALNGLPLTGQLGNGLPVVIPPPQLEPARLLFYLADAKTYGQSYEFVIGTDPDDPTLEYRIRIDNRDYQNTLSGLQYLLGTASREGRAVWMEI